MRNVLAVLAATLCTLIAVELMNGARIVTDDTGTATKWVLLFATLSVGPVIALMLAKSDQA